MSLGAGKPKGLNSIAKMSYGYLCLRKTYLSFDKLHYLGTVNFKPKYIYTGAIMSWSYGSWIYNYLCNQCLSPLTLWWGVLTSTLCDKVCQWLVAGQWFSPGTPVFPSNKTGCHNITEISMKLHNHNPLYGHFYDPRYI